MSAEEISRVEEIVNEKIRQNIPVVIQEMKKEDALALGAMALFGEKYGDLVRVVIIDPNYSVELCGGTHVGATGELGFFVITHETAIAAGVRRVEALCGKSAGDYVNRKMAELKAIQEQLKNPQDALKAIDGMMEEIASTRKRIEKFEAKNIASEARQLSGSFKKTETGINYIGAIAEVESAE